VRRVLVEGASKQGQGQLFGRTTWNRIVNFSGPSELIGQLVPVRVTRSYRNSQLGSWRFKGYKFLPPRLGASASIRR